ncbi:GATOR complex protein NPRL2-like [Paramacrobiotus metropolitanus]|uniref:GATOR complex protein NPRL2-like n=1 Tax=Paramacrobiotus metropolitanus TaxID=2943436 RepID=UPI00244578C3|nr:GATOR complex protein NPRL2-like [Paramacrobiotus metropolitanus]
MFRCALALAVTSPLYRLCEISADYPDFVSHWVELLGFVFWIFGALHLFCCAVSVAKPNSAVKRYVSTMGPLLPDVQRDDLIFPPLALPNQCSLMRSVSKINHIFFSEFDNVAGPKIVFEVPENKFTTTGIFDDQISSFIITKPELTSSVLTITAGDYKILGYPVLIENTKYQRNALIFNLCFVYDCEDDIRPYESIVKKLGEYLRTVEVETNFLSKPESKRTLPQLMEKLLHELNSLGRCSIAINKSNTLFLKVVPPDRNSDIVVHDYDVPVLVSDMKGLIALEKDLTTKQIVPLIDGTRSVHQISDEVDADGDLVKSCVQNMMFYGVARVVPAFNLSNVYRVTPAIRKFLCDAELCEKCIQFVARDKNDPPGIRDIMTILGDMQHGVAVADWSARHSNIIQKLDQKKLCDFGILQGFIRRMYKYPVNIRFNHISSRSRTIQRFFNGTTHTDEIRTKPESLADQKDLDDKLDADASIRICWK